MGSGAACGSLWKRPWGAPPRRAKETGDICAKSGGLRCRQAEWSTEHLEGTGKVTLRFIKKNTQNIFQREKSSIKRLMPLRFKCFNSLSLHK